MAVYLPEVSYQARPGYWRCERDKGALLLTCTPVIRAEDVIPFLPDLLFCQSVNGGLSSVAVTFFAMRRMAGNLLCILILSLPYISFYPSNSYSDKLLLTAVTPASAGIGSAS